MNIGIFIPIYYREMDLTQCLSGLSDSNLSNHTVHLRFGINGGSVDLKRFVHAVSQGFLDNRLVASSEVIEKTNNIGKPSIVNEMVTACAKDHHLDYVVSLDSDMVAIDIDWMNDFVLAFQGWKEATPLGAICSEQIGNSCHVKKNPIEIKSNSMTLITLPHNEGIAGGMLMTPYAVWEQLGGYHAHRLYASDDGHYMLSLAQSGYQAAILEDAVFSHPHSKDTGYAEWKHRATSDTLEESEKHGYWNV